MFLPGIRGNYKKWGSMYDRLSEDYGWLPSNFSRPYYVVPMTDPHRPELNYSTVNWREPLFESSNLPVNRSGGSDQDITVYTRHLWPSDLQHAMEEAHKVVAAPLMFNGFTSPAKSWTEPNLIACVPWTQLVPGRIPPLLVVVMLVMWTMGCVVLGIIYGFRKRWDALVLEACTGTVKRLLRWIQRR